MARCLYAWILAHGLLFLLASTAITDLAWLASCAVSSFILAMYINRQNISPFSSTLAMIIYIVSAMNGLASVVYFFSAHIPSEIFLAIFQTQYKASIVITVVEVLIFVKWIDSELRKRPIINPTLIHSSD